jgi:nucleotide-binding universal stress UspA family protein
MTDSRPFVLVGVDGSEPSLRAAEWAAADAAAAGLTVTVCYVSDVSALADVPLPQEVRQAARAYGRRMVDRALVRIRHATPVDAAGEVADGNPAAELIRRAAGAQQVVLGSRGAGGFERLVLGSVGAEVAAHAPGPVVVVRGGGHERHEVVVGVDASDRSHRALEYAFQYAGRHGGRIHAVHAVHAVHDRAAPLPMPPVSARAWMAPEQNLAARELLADAVAPWALKYPAVEVESTVVDGSAAWGLVQASKGAALVVVGTRGHGGFTGLLLGSVSQALLRHTDCPVAVVR